MCDDTKGLIRSHKSKDERQYNGQMCEDTKELIGSHKSKVDKHSSVTSKEKRIHYRYSPSY